MKGIDTKRLREESKPGMQEFVAFMKEECKPGLDDFYSHADPLVRDVRNMAVKILNRGAERD